MTLLAITTVFRTILIIIGVFVVLKLVGQMMVAKRNLEEERDMLKAERKNREEAEEAKKNHGKISISSVDKKKLDNAQYTDYEELK